MKRDDERGEAHVTVAGTGATGWVDNAKLLWRRPTPQTETAPAVGSEAPGSADVAPVQSGAEPPSSATAHDAAAVDTATTAAEAPAEEPAAPEPPRPPKKPARASIFDPY